MKKSAALVGASGLVGAQLLDQLRDIPRLEVWSRRPIDLPANVRATVASQPPVESAPFWEVETLFVALGTTIAKAGSRDAFAAVDLQLVLECARRARHSGVTTLALVSALGADPDSRIFYNRIKGLAEKGVRELGFPRVVIARPSLLLGDRQEFRAGEWISRKLMGPVRQLLPRSIRPIRDAEVARALVNSAKESGWSGVRILENGQMVG